jgi:hypothetical protein
VHAWDGRLFELATSLHWLAGAFLLTGILALRRVGVPLLWGRKAIVLWLLVLLLHAHAALSTVPQPAQAPVAGLTLVTLGEAIGGVFAALTLLVLVSFARGASPRLRSRRVDQPLVRRPAAASGFLIVFSPRPPPAPAL